MFRNHDAVLDDAGRRATVVPHQRIEVGHVHQQDIRIIHNVAGVGGRFARRVMFQEDPWEPTLFR